MGHAFPDVEIERHHAVPLPVRQASMGPRLCGRGDIFNMVQKGTTTQPLQWGHAFPSVEMMPAPGAWTTWPTSFNGATPFQAWRSVTVAAGISAAAQLQWGHALPGVETRCGSAGRPRRAAGESHPACKLAQGRARAACEGPARAAHRADLTRAQRSSSLGRPLEKSRSRHRKLRRSVPRSCPRQSRDLKRGPTPADNLSRTQATTGGVMQR